MQKSANFLSVISSCVCLSVLRLAMQRKPVVTELRTPTDTWSGLGFSKSMPAEAIKELRNVSRRCYKPYLSTISGQQQQVQIKLLLLKTSVDTAVVAVLSELYFHKLQVRQRMALKAFLHTQHIFFYSQLSLSGGSPYG